MWSPESEINSIGMTTMRHSISASSGEFFLSFSLSIFPTFNFHVGWQCNYVFFVEVLNRFLHVTTKEFHAASITFSIFCKKKEEWSYLLYKIYHTHSWMKNHYIMFIFVPFHSHYMLDLKESILSDFN